MNKKSLLYFFNFFSIIAFDRITKWLIITHAQNKILTPLPGLNISLIWNRGVTWGIFNHSSPLGFLVLSTTIALIILVFLLYTIFEYRQGTTVFFETFVLAGAISNFFDRCYYGAVIDFIDCYVGSWHWAIFNVADMAIVIGVFGIMGRMFLCSQKKN